MSYAVMLSGILFNILNAIMQGYWIFFESFNRNYQVCGLSYADVAWLWSPQFIIGTIIFFTGWCINIHSDYVIRHLRKPGDTNHYLPKKGLYKYVTSANYLGEITEWLGFAILTWSLAGLLFFWFSCCNLVPRSNAIYKKYEEEFPDEFDRKKLKRIIPFIY